jgi:hypothetical protein
MGPSQWTWIARLLKAVESLVGLALMSLYFLISILPLYYYFQWWIWGVGGVLVFRLGKFISPLFIYFWIPLFGLPLRAEGVSRLGMAENIMDWVTVYRGEFYSWHWRHFLSHVQMYCTTTSKRVLLRIQDYIALYFDILHYELPLWTCASHLHSLPKRNTVFIL